jgi:hypothetical protein
MGDGSQKADHGARENPRRTSPGEQNPWACTTGSMGGRRYITPSPGQAPQCPLLPAPATVEPTQEVEQFPALAVPALADYERQKANPNAQVVPPSAPDSLSDNKFWSSFLDERAETLRLKWIESQKAGRDLGFTSQNGEHSAGMAVLSAGRHARCWECCPRSPALHAANRGGGICLPSATERGRRRVALNSHLVVDTGCGMHSSHAASACRSDAEDLVHGPACRSPPVRSNRLSCSPPCVSPGDCRKG